MSGRIRPFAVLLATFVTVLLGLAAIGQAAVVYTWTGATSVNWSGANWSASFTPLFDDTIQFDATSTANLLNNDDIATIDVGQIRMVDPAGPVVVINGASTINLYGIVGAGPNVGIDMSTATQNLTLSPGIVLKAAQTWDTGTKTLTVDGVLGGAGFDLAKIGSGTLTLSGTTANTLSGNLVHKAGLILLSKSAGVDAIAGNLDVDPSAGHPVVRWTANNQINDAAQITLRGYSGIGSGHLDLNGFSESIGGLTIINNQGTGSTTVATGAGTLTLLGNVDVSGTSPATGAAPAGTSTVLLTGNAIGNTGGTLNLAGGTRTFNISAGGNAIINANVTNGGILKTGATNLQLRGTNDFVGGITATAGLVDFTADNNLGGALNVITLNGGGVQYNGATAFTLSRTLNIGASGGIIGVAQTAGPLSQNTADQLVGTGATTMTKSGAGTFTLNAANPNLTAAWNVAGGTLVVANRAGLGTTSAAPTITLSGGTARLLGVNASVASAGVNGLNGYYYNFGVDPQSNSSRYASEQLMTGRVFTRVDTNPLTLDMPTTSYPRDPVVGFQVPDLLGMMWKGLLKVTTAGDYTFRMSHDDYASIYIDGQEMLANAANTGGAGTFRTSAAINLGAGSHSIVVKFTQGTGGRYLRAQYAGADTGGASSYQIIGSTAGTVTTGSLAPLTYGTVGGGGTMDILAPSTATGFTLANGQTFTLTSPTIDNLTITGSATIDTATTAGVLAPTSGALIFNTGIGQATSGSMLTVAGPYLTQFNAANSYTGITTVTGGRLELNATGGNSIAGDLDLNASDASGALVNVQLKQSNQIVDTAAVTVRNGSILDLGANSDTVNSLTVQNRGLIVGSGTLTTSGVAGQGGAVLAILAGTGGLTKTTAGTLVLGGANTYAGSTDVQAGILSIRSNAALGVAGLGNGTSVQTGAQLQLLGGLTTNEAIAVAGTGVNASNPGVLRNINGVNTINGTVALNFADATFHSDAGNLVFGNATTAIDGQFYFYNATFQGAGDFTLNGVAEVGAITKNGSGALIFGYDVFGSLPTMTWNAGVLGFKGPQTLGTVTVGTLTAPAAATTWRFDSDPGAGNTVVVPAGKGLIGGFAVDQTFLGRIDGSSAGFLALGQSNTNNLDFTALPGVSLGATTWVDYTGTITPGAAGYRLGGGGGELHVRSILSGNNPLTVSGAGVVYLHDSVVNTFAGNVTVDGGILRIAENDSLGAGSNVVTLTNGGKLTLIQSTSNIGSLFGELGNAIGQGTRQINVGAGGGIIAVESYNNVGSAYALSGVNPLTGSGTLTKTEYGALYLLNNSDFSGNLIIDGLGGRVDVRSSGKLPNVASVEIRQSAELNIDDQNGLGSRQFANVVDSDRIRDGATITLRGGSLSFTGKNAAPNDTELVGTVVLAEGRDAINVNRSGGGGAQLTVANLQRALNGGVLRVGGSANTWGTATGDNSRLVFTLLNGTAPTAGMVLPWATVFDDNYAIYGGGALVGVNSTTGTAQASGTGFAPVSTTLYNFNTGTASATLTLAAGNQQLAGFRFGNGNVATNALLFAAATDTLFVGEGVIISDNNNQTRTIGAAATRGNLTAGLSGATSPKELIFHANQGTLAIESNIIDNNGQPVSVIKGTGAGFVELRAGAGNTYSGGTYIYSGRINVTSAGGLGSGPVLIKGAQLQLNAAGATTNTTGIIARDQSEIYLPTNNIAYNAAGDRFIVEPGSTITGPTFNVNSSIASLTRVDMATFTGSPAGGQVVLYPEAIIRSTDSPQGDVMTNMIANLGINADLYYNQSGGFEQNQFITVGAGTPWKGLSSSFGEGWHTGTIFANGDFWLQGLQRVGGNVTMNIGRASSSGSALTGSWAVVNQSGQPIKAYVTGAVALNEDTPVNLPNDLTFVVTKDGLFQPNYANSFGDMNVYGTRASVLVKAGGTLDPGNYTPINPYGDAATFGKQYALPSPVNTNLVVESAGRFLINDASGIGSVTGGATWTMKTGSILQLDDPNAFFGSDNGLIQSSGSPFVFEPGAIVRQYDDDRIFKMDQFVSGATGGQGVIYEIANGDKNLTEYLNPFVAAATGTPRAFGQDITVGAGGGITNDVSDRTVRNRRGTVYLGNGATLSATTQTVLQMSQNFAILPNSTVTIGSTQFIDGLPKLGTVRFNRENNAVGNNTTSITVTDGSQIAIGSINVIPDATSVYLPTAATTFGVPAAGGGTAIALDSNGNTEFIGKLTGNGTVYSNQDTAALGVGFGATTDFTFDGVIKAPWASGDNRNDPQFVKVGPTKMTMTNTSDSLGVVTVYQGELAFAGANGKWTGGSLRISKGGTMTFDNTVDVVTNRFLSTGYLTTVGGGDFKVLGHATDVGDVYITNLATGTGSAIPSYSGGNPGGIATISVVPSGNLSTLRTSLTFNQYENVQNAGERLSVWLVRGVGVAGLPGTYDSTGAYTPNPANPKDGLVFITNPRFTGGGAYDANGGASGIIVGGPGSPVVPVRGDLLASSDPNATQGEFATIDVASGVNRTGVRPLQASEYSSNSLTVGRNAAVGLNVRAPASTALNYSGDSRFQVLKMENGSSLNVSGTLPALTQPSQIVLNGGGILVPTGATASIAAAADSIFRTNGGVSAYLHTYGNLNVSGEFFSDQGLVKTGSGTATFAAGSLDNLRGHIAVNEGTLNINDTLVNVRQSATGASAFDGIHFALNGGTLNLNGNSQYVNRLESGNILAGAATEGSTLTSASPATLAVQGGGTFSGHITGAISLDKVGNNTLFLTNTNSTAGTARVRQGTLSLRDSGTLPNITQYDISYARLDLDNGWLAGVPTRINPTATLNMRGGDFIVRGRAGELITTNVAAVNVDAGTAALQSVAGGGGANETIIGNLTRDPGSFVAFQQSNGFMGTPGNDSTAIRYKLTQLNGSAVSLTNSIIGGWAIANSDHFATYDATLGVSYLSNTEDGFANYNNTDLSTASASTGTQNFNDGSTRTIPAGAIVNSIRNAPGGGQTLTLSGALTVNSGGILTNANQAISYTGTSGSITSGGSELYLWVQQNTTTFNSKLTGNVSLLVGGGGTTKLQGPGNDYTGTTYANGGVSGGSGRSGTLQLDVTGANGTSIVAIPKDLWIGNTFVSELRANQIAQSATITLEGGGGLDLVNAASTTETFKAFVFVNAGGDANPRAIVSRSAQQTTSTLALTGATPITATNDNPVSTPAFGQNLGLIAFAGADGSPQTLMITSPVSVNGLSAAGFILNGGVVDVPAGVDDGGLVKDGNGVLIVGGNVASTFGSPGTPTEVFNIKTGYVRVDSNDALGPNNAITTVQSGAVLLFNGSTVNGSLQLKDGSTIASTMASTTLGAVGSAGTVNVPSGATIEAQTRDYFIPASNTSNIVINHKLTGAGTINLVGIEYAAGYNGGGLFQLRNTANDFAGTINVGTNSVLEVNSNTGTGGTLGTAAINLNGGVLRSRDQGNNTGGAETITYGNNVTLNADSYINLDRQGTAASNKTIAFGTLTVPTGDKNLSVNNGNNFRVSFNQVAGSGTLVKGGTGHIDINGYDAGFSGNIQVAGPQGLNLSASGNLWLNAASNSIANLTVGGFHTIGAGTTVAISGALDVNRNAGQVLNGLGYNGGSYVPVSNGGVTGVVLVDGTATLTAGTLRNNGVVGPTGSAAAIGATTIVGSGVYNAYNNNLTLNGGIADDGAILSKLRVAGTNTVEVTALASTYTGGTEVQTGTLRVAPTAAATNPLGTGGVRVFAAPATSLVAGSSQPVAALASTLHLDTGSGNNITQAGAIANNGLVRVSGTGVVSTGAISGTSVANLSNLSNFLAATVPGLSEGIITGSGTLDTTAGRPANQGQFGVTLEPRMGQTNVVTQNPLTGWGDNTAWVYTGYFYDADGKFTFAENIDDNVLISIDGVTRLNNAGSNITSTATTSGQRGAAQAANTNTASAADLVPISGTGIAANPDLPAGWHSLEIRMHNGGGGAGPWGVSNGFTNNYGLGLNPDGTMTLDGTQFFRPIDDGSGNLFRTANYGGGTTEVDPGASLIADSIVQDTLIIGAGGSVTIKPSVPGAAAAEANAVPEPGTLALLLTLVLAGGSVWAARRGRRAK